MSIRRKILILTATLFAVTCAIVLRLNSDPDERQEVWVNISPGWSVSLADATVASTSPTSSEPTPSTSEIETEMPEAVHDSKKSEYPLVLEVKDRPVLRDLPSIALTPDLFEVGSADPGPPSISDSVEIPTATIAATTSAKKAQRFQLPTIRSLRTGDESESSWQNQKIENPFFHSSVKSTSATQSLPTESSAQPQVPSNRPVDDLRNDDFVKEVPQERDSQARPDLVFDLNLESSDSSGIPGTQQPASTSKPAEHVLQNVRLAEHPASMSKPSSNPRETGERPAPSARATPSGPRVPQNNGQPAVLQNATNFLLAEQPKQGANWNNPAPVTDARAVSIPPMKEDFSPTPLADSQTGDCQIYDPYEQQQIYEGKTLNAVQRPLLEFGRPWYQLGQLNPPSNLLGNHNPIDNQFIVFGDFRNGLASNSQDGDSSTLFASQLNLNFDWKVTSTERFHMFVSPLTKGLDSTGYLFDEEDFLNNTNANIPFGYFEGDLGAMVGGLTRQTYPFDLPFAIGVIPMLFQNGVWMEENILGFAFTIPSRNSARFDISNLDITFFAGFDKMLTDALPGDNSAGRVYGIASFIEAWNGYVEADYAFIEDRTFLDRSYHNFGLGYTRRFGRFVSNSTRAIVNLGQDPSGIDQTADGWLLLSENSLITGAPSTVVPYFNLFAGFDRPQSVARNALAGGVLRNTGILFETDNLTRYPTLDASANNTYGAALGLNLLASDFSQQLILETAVASTMGPDLGRNAVGNQYGLGARYQLPLTNSLILRTDLMYGFFESTDDSHGARIELRRKF
jgi:hypothetical protein